jgi:hypothetical protein
VVWEDSTSLTVAIKEKVDTVLKAIDTDLQFQKGAGSIGVMPEVHQQCVDSH